MAGGTHTPALPAALAQGQCWPQQPFSCPATGQTSPLCLHRCWLRPWLVPRLLRASLATVQARKVRPYCYCSRDPLTAMQNHPGHTSMGLLAFPRAGPCASMSLSSRGEGTSRPRSAPGSQWSSGWLVFWMKGLAQGSCSLQTSARGFISRSKSARSISLLHGLPAGLVNLL